MLKNSNVFRVVAFVVVFCGTTSAHAGKFQLEGSEVFIPKRLGKLSLIHDEEGFCVEKGNNVHRVQKCFSDSLLRSISSDHLKKFLEGGYVSVDQMSDGEFALKAYDRLKGGGPVAGAVAYWVTKSLCYGTAAAAATGVTVATGGLAGAATGGLVTASTLGFSAGASVASGIIAGAGAAEGAALVTAGAITGAGGLVAAVAAVETASMSVSAVFTLCPFLP